MKKQMQSNEKIAMKVSRNTIIGNLVLTAFKLFAGIVAKSGAMLSDAVHSASDVATTVIVMIGVKIANKEPDESHPYGHERLESVAAIILSLILFGTGLGIGYSGLQKIIVADYNTLVIPGALALIAAIISIVVKEVMYWYTRKAAKKVDSGALMADAWHHRSDALSSIGSFIGIFGARLGFPILDPIASIVICLFILKASFDIFIDGINKLIDKACDGETVNEIEKIIQEEKGVVRIDSLKTRLFGDKYYVDVEISADGNSSLNDSHHIAERIHDKVEKMIPKVKHCMVHVNPVDDASE